MSDNDPTVIFQVVATASAVVTDANGNPITPDEPKDEQR